MFKLSEKELKKLLQVRPDITVEGEVSNKEPTSPNKLGAVKTSIKTPEGEYLFDSGLEADRYGFLLTLQTLEVIKNLDCEHKRKGRSPDDRKRHTWVLQEAIQGQRDIHYTDDFQYELQGVGLVVEDIKGYVTAEAKRTWKIFRYKYPDVRFFINYKLDSIYPGI